LEQKPSTASFALKRIPRATYRLQFNRQFTLRHALEIVPYLDELGISDVYASPLFQACGDSTHGYDVCDFTRLNSCLGTEEYFTALTSALRARGMGLIVDMVPNHMGIADPANRWWMDVLANGRASRSAPFFDIDWDSPVPGLRGKVMLPVLGDRFEAVLERGEIQLGLRDGEVRVTYFEHSFPVSADGWRMILRRAAELDRRLKGLALLRESLERESADACRFAALVRECAARDAPCRRAIEAALQHFNAHEGRAELSELLEAQFYRLAWWRRAARELNYRRFFDVTGLAGLRVENPEVFAASHELLLRWLREGKVTGVRVDHPDGLREPSEYFARLQQSAGGSAALRCRAECAQPPRGIGVPRSSGLGILPDARSQASVYVVVEKILSPGEELPCDWLVDGTTGYDFLAELNTLFVNPANAAALDEIYAGFVGERLDYDEVVRSRKRFILETSLSAETESLARRLVALAQPRDCPCTIDDARGVIVELIAALPVYRTYLSTISPRPSAQDAKFLAQAVERCATRSSRREEAPSISCDRSEPPHVGCYLSARPALLNFIVRLFASPVDEAALDFVLRFQQLSGPATAKGVEDTSFYIYNRLISLNEVGGDPKRFGGTMEDFHAQNLARLKHWPHSMLATSTHDTKRGEDARARINVLSEIPGEWRAALARWRALTVHCKSGVNGRPAPDANDELLLFQSLIGAWPEAEPVDLKPFTERLKNYALKAVRESKRHTSWIDPNPAYEAAVTQFIERALDPHGLFLDDFRRFQNRVAFFGRLNSLAQTLLKIASPGVPDFYQGSELWNLTLVDPDNRRPVDFETRRATLAELRPQMARDRTALVRELARSNFDARAKMFVTHAALEFRRRHETLFRDGHYIPVEVQGPHRAHVCAFARRRGDELAVIVAPRWTVGLTRGAEVPPLGEEVWADTTLELPFAAAPSEYENIFTGEKVRPVSVAAGLRLHLRDVFQSWPVALLTNDPGSPPA